MQTSVLGSRGSGTWGRCVLSVPGSGCWSSPHAPSRNQVIRVGALGFLPGLAGHVILRTGSVGVEVRGLGSGHTQGGGLQSHGTQSRWVPEVPPAHAVFTAFYRKAPPFPPIPEQPSLSGSLQWGSLPHAVTLLLPLVCSQNWQLHLEDS